MKKYFIKKLIFTFSVLSVSFLAAQNSPEKSEEKIILPEVTTTVSGDSLTAGKDAVPDFTSILPVQDENPPLPKLPGVKSSDTYSEPEADLTVAADKQIYAQGLIGGGFPGYFTGDFSVYKSSGAEPFLLRFSHLSQNGYGKHSARDGYFDSTTTLRGEKIFSVKNTMWNLSASYDRTTYGLQNKSPAFYEMNYQTVETSDFVRWFLPKGFSLALGFDGQWYNRYAGVPENSVDVILKQEENSDIITFNPSFESQWGNTNFNVFFDTSYTLEFLNDSEFVKYGSEEKNDVSSISRADFILGGSWTGKNLYIALKGGVAAGTEMGDNSVIPLAEASFEGKWNMPSMDRLLFVNVKGGIDSRLSLCSDLEKDFNFTTQTFLPYETSDWFAMINMTIPAGSKITIEGTSEFRKTAFNNGVWEADYDSPLYTKVYEFKQIDRSILTSKVNLSYLWKIFTVDFSWKSNYFHVPSNDYRNTFGATLSFQSETGKWGFEASAFEAVDKDADLCPVINVSGFIKLRDAIRFSLEIDDGVKLISRSGRDYGNSMYIKNSGSAKLLVKFFF
ncbi:MAG: hypothetical protein SO116_02205 [Treponema sp.]|nr:hypothetical protein [Treponema sp.]